MLVFILLLAACQAWQHFASFNDQCSAELSFLRGTKAETSISGGRLPYQFKLALEEVIKERIRVEGCDAGSNYDKLFGMTMKNVMRFLDSSDTSLDAVTVPTACDSPFIFNWKKLREGFPGIVLPSSCKSSDFQTSGRCQIKFKFIENLFIELVIQDNCNNDAQPGYKLPSINLFCSGSLCESFARPCSSNGDCSAGATCDALREGFGSLADSLEPLIAMGLFQNSTDYAGCTDATNSFQEKFWSGIINSGANLLGLTSTTSTNIYHDVKLCGVSQLIDKIMPSQAPTPAAAFKCDDVSQIPAYQVCDGSPQCAGGEDEEVCSYMPDAGTTYRCGSGSITSPNTGSCCPVCLNPDYGYFGCTNEYCANVEQEDEEEFLGCTITDGVFNCPQVMLASSTPIPNSPEKQSLKSVTATSADQHIIGWGDCDGNIQIGSAGELGVINARLPIHKVIAEFEKVISSLESCRSGTKPVGSAWARYFYPWATSFWGGLFFSDQASQGFFNNVNPGAKLDANLPYYSSAQQAPYANVANAPSSCDLASTTGDKPSCELAADISSWFAGPSFPAGWSGPTTVKAKFASTCVGSSAPTVFFTCEGKCDSNAKSGCCILRNAIVRLANGACPSGYELNLVNTGLTNFIFNYSTTPKSNDTTLVNFLALLVAHQTQFGANAPFIGVQASEALRSVCILNGSDFEANTELWAKTAATEDCPVPATPPNGTKGCPQFLPSGSIKGCSGSSCQQVPIPVQCNPQCPLPGESISSALVLVPALGLCVMLGLF